MEDQLKKIIAVIAELDSPEVIKNDSNLKDDLGMDSLMMIDLVIDIGDQLGVKISAAEKVKLQTFNDVVNLVASSKSK